MSTEALVKHSQAGKELIPPTIPEYWDYSDSVSRVRTLVMRWKDLTLEIATELWIAREKLSYSPTEAALVMHGTNVPRTTWAGYCEAIGLEKRTANRWLAAIFGNVRLAPPPLPQIESQVLYADPPWAFSNAGLDQSAAQQYETLNLELICNYTDGKRTVRQLARDKASVLFLWVPEALIPEGLQVTKAWAFEYKAQFVWKKDRAPGIGWWVNSKHELLFIGVRGSPLHPAIKHDSVFEAPVTQHSRKPKIVYEMIEAMYSGPYIELFAREPRSGWISWGNEIKRS